MPTFLQVTQRRHAIGIRMALGANQRNILEMVLRQGLRLALLGIAAGLVGALTHFLSSILFRVSALDLEAFALGAMGLAVVLLLACCLPARRHPRGTARCSAI
jgi:putative ABC transport system permease protein